MNPNRVFLKKENQELVLFLAITYGVPFLMAIPMAAFYYAGKDVSSFPAAQMFYPAAGLMIAKLVGKREDPLLPKKFFTGFLILTGTMVLWCIVGAFLPDDIRSVVGFCLLGGGTIVIGVLYFAEEKEKRAAYGLLSKNWKTSIPLLILYVGLLYAVSFTNTILTAGADGLRDFDPSLFYSFLISLPLLFILNFPSFLGEEYGWRVYFQPLLQRKFGLIRGVLLFGVLWESWHLPLVFFYYAPLQSSASLAQLIVLRYVSTTSIAVFMAYAYMKTNNVWLPVLIHFANNGIASLGEDGGTMTWTMLGILILIRMAFFLPLLFSKVFRLPSQSGGDYDGV